MAFRCGSGRAVGVSDEEAGGDSLDGVVGAEEHGPHDEAAAADGGRRGGETVEESPHGEEQQGGEDQLSDVDDEPAVDDVVDALEGAVSAGHRVEQDQHRPEQRCDGEEVVRTAVGALCWFSAHVGFLPGGSSGCSSVVAW